MPTLLHRAAADHLHGEVMIVNDLGLQLLDQLLIRCLCIENALLAFLELFLVLHLQNADVLSCHAHAFVDEPVRELFHLSRSEA